MKKNFKHCFTNAHCCDDCPNCQIDEIDNKYGYGIADDMGLKKIDCKKCQYNTNRCEDCLFQNCKECPEYDNAKHT